MRSRRLWYGILNYIFFLPPLACLGSGCFLVVRASFGDSTVLILAKHSLRQLKVEIADWKCSSGTHTDAVS